MLLNLLTRVTVLDNDTLRPLWMGADVMHVSIREASRITRFAVEDGTNRNDHVVDEPTEITLRLVMVGAIPMFFEMLRWTYHSHDLVIVQTRSGVYMNMMVEEIPQEQDAGMTDATIVDVRLVEWREVTPEYGELTPEKVDKPAQADTVNRGTQATTEAPAPKKQSVLRSMFSA